MVCSFVCGLAICCFGERFGCGSDRSSCAGCCLVGLDAVWLLCRVVLGWVWCWCCGLIVYAVVIVDMVFMFGG